MLSLIQVTAQYSNAVLIAILPQISDFVSKAHVPIATPVTIRQVETFKCSPVKGDIGGAVVFTNGLWVLYLQGHVYDMRTPRSYYNLQNARDIPKFFGSVRLNKEEALEFVRNAIRRIGYLPSESFTDQEPEIDMPINIGTNIIPYYRFLWRDPVVGKTAVRVELNADLKTIEEIRLSSPFFWRNSSKITVEPEDREPFDESKLNIFVGASLVKIDQFGRQLNLPIRFPIKAQDVQSAELLGASGALIRLTNGYSFACENGMVTEFSAPDSISNILPTGPPPKPFSDYLGEWNLTEPEAVEIVRQAIEKLGYRIRDFEADRAPDIKKSVSVGRYLVPRYRLFWIANDPQTGKTVSLVSAEVNGDKKRLEHLQLVGGPLPVSAQTINGRPNPFTNSNSKSQIGSNLMNFIDQNMRSGSNAELSNPTIKPSNPFE